MRVALEDVTVAAGERMRLDGVSATFEPGTVTALIGADGAGKSTLLQVLAGGTAPTGGRCERPRDRHAIGYQGADSGVWPTLSVAENVAFVASVYGLDARTTRARAGDLLARAGLEGVTDRLAGRLSGGMRRKLGVVLATLHRPGLVLLDEPTTGVDPISRAELWSLVAAAAAEGATVVLATTYLDEAERADRLLLLGEGRLLAAGTAEEIVARTPGTLWQAPVTLAQARRALGREDTWRRAGTVFRWSPEAGAVAPEGFAPAPGDLENTSIALLLAGASVGPSTRAGAGAGAGTPAGASAGPSKPAGAGAGAGVGTPAGASAGAGPDSVKIENAGASAERRDGRADGASHAGADGAGDVGDGGAGDGGAGDGGAGDGGAGDGDAGDGDAGDRLEAVGLAIDAVARPSTRPRPSADLPLVEAIGVSRTYGSFAALADVSLDVAPGEVVGLLGGNGAGKTTLIRILLGLETASAGEVRLFGERPCLEGRRGVGYVAQGLGLYPTLSATENLAFAAAVHGVPVGDAARALAAGLGRTPVASLPLGTRRVVACLAATVHRPDLLVLDEPTSGMDALTRARLWRDLRVGADAGTGVLVTTHYMEEAAQCDRLVVLGSGVVAAAGTVEQITAGRTSLTVRTEHWQEAFDLLRRAGTAVLPERRTLRLPGADPDRVRAVLAPIAGRVAIGEEPATLGETMLITSTSR